MTYETAMFIECWVVIVLGVAAFLTIIYWLVSSALENYYENKRIASITHSKEFELQTEKKIEEMTTKIELITQRLKRLENEKSDKK